MKIKNEVTDIIADSRIEGTALYLPPRQLERNLYVAVNKVLEALGGKWNRKAKAHIFAESPEDIIEEILQTGEYVCQKSEYDFFETPEPLARRLVEMARIDDGGTVLEPSAGHGAIAQFMDCDCIELEEDNQRVLTEGGYRLVGEDFLQFSAPYDYIIANPPFSRQRDIDHVTHMIHLARKCVVSVMSASVLFRTNRKTVEFRELVDQYGGTITPLPEGSFKASGTGVNTCVVEVRVAT